MSGLNPKWSDDAVRDRALQKTAGLPPESRPGSATAGRIDSKEVHRIRDAVDGLRSPPDEDFACT